MLAEAPHGGVEAYCARFADPRDENGYRLVVRNGYHGARDVAAVAGAVKIRAPRVNDRRVDLETGERRRFSSAILPPGTRKTSQVEQVLPLLLTTGATGPDPNGCGAQAAKGCQVAGVWKTVHLFVPSDRSANEVSRYLCDHINAVAYEAGEFVRQVRIGEGVEQGTGWHKWSVSYLPGLAGEGLCE